MFIVVREGIEPPTRGFSVRGLGAAREVVIQNLVKVPDPQFLLAEPQPIKPGRMHTRLHARQIVGILI